MGDAGMGDAGLGEAVGDEEEAARQLQLAAEDLSRVQDSYPAHFIRENSWSDPVLEQERFLQLRERLALP